MIHPTALIDVNAVLGSHVSVGPYTIIHGNVVVGDDTVIGSHCEIGVPSSLSGGRALVIGKSSLIRSHSVFYEGSEFGDRLSTGHRVTVREKTKAGEALQIGTLSDIQGHCEIGDYVKFHSNVHVGQHSKIGNYVWIFPYVVLTNDPHPPSNVMQGVTVSDYAVIATMSVILPGAYIAEGCLIGAHSSLSGITEADTIYAGTPAKAVGATSKLKLKDGSRKPAYPWRAHFTRGYPEDVVQQWVKEFSQDV